MTPSSRLEVTNKAVRGARLASQSVLVIKEQILGINYNLEKFQVLIKTSGSWQAARLSSQCLGRVLGLVLPFKLPTWPQNTSSVSPTKSRATSHHQGWHRKGISWSRDEFVLSVLSELIPWAPGCAGVWFRELNPPFCFVTTCGVFTPKAQAQVWWWLPSVQEWLLGYVAQTVVVVVQPRFQCGKAVQSLPKLCVLFTSSGGKFFRGQDWPIRMYIQSRQ